MPAGGRGCPPCAVRSLRRDSPMHTRDRRTCRWPDVVSRHWECPACQDDKYRNARLSDPGHTFEFGKCKFADRGSPPRVGAHPRDPRPVAKTHPSAEASSHDAIAQEPIEGPPDLQGRAFGEDMLGREALPSGDYDPLEPLIFQRAAQVQALTKIPKALFAETRRLPEKVEVQTKDKG